MKLWCRVESLRLWGLRELGPCLALGMGQILGKPMMALSFINHKELLEFYFFPVSFLLSSQASLENKLGRKKRKKYIS
jgi:hypothetical protein